MIKLLTEKYHGICCGKNYTDALIDKLDEREFSNLTYTRDIQDWQLFVERKPEEYSRWIQGCCKECGKLELTILDKLVKQDRLIFVDTNIPVEVLKEISDYNHVLIMLSDPKTFVNRIFDRPDFDKQFIYKLLLNEKDPEEAINNYKKCLEEVNSKENYNKFMDSGFFVISRNESRTIRRLWKKSSNIYAKIKKLLIKRIVDS